MSVGPYDTMQTLGSGAFGTVTLVKRTGTNKSFAMKSISKRHIIRSQMGPQVKKEIQIMKSINHPNIVKIEEVLMSSEYLYIVMEYAQGGELYAKITKGGRLPEESCKKYVYQLCSALDFCHAKNICHRDIKPQNILLDDSDNIKLADFGFASIMEVEEQNEMYKSKKELDNTLERIEYDDRPDEFERSMVSDSKRTKCMSTVCGTQAYMAPEILYREKYMGDKADVWSMGIVVYVLLVGFMPFREEDHLKNSYTTPRFLSLHSKDILSRMLDVDSTSRWPFSRLLCHIWLKRKESDFEHVDEVVNTSLSSDKIVVTNTNEEENISTDSSESEPDIIRSFDIQHVLPLKSLRLCVVSSMENLGWRVMKVSENILRGSILSSEGINMVSVSLDSSSLNVRNASVRNTLKKTTMKTLQTTLVKDIQTYPVNA